jgi:hypothetical protein
MRESDAGGREMGEEEAIVYSPNRTSNIQHPTSRESPIIKGQSVRLTGQK